MRTVAAVVVGAGLIVLASLATTVAARAAEPQPSGSPLDPTGRVSLASQTPWVAAGGTFSMRVDIANVRRPEALELSVTLHPAIGSRSQFVQTLGGALLGDPLWRGPDVAIAGAALDSGGAIPVTVELRTAGEPFDPSRPELPKAGVHPVRVELREVGTGGVVDAFTTHLVRSREDEADALAVAWVQPFGAPPALQPDASVEVDDAARRELTLVAQLLGADKVPLSFEPTPETLDALAATAPEAVDELRGAIGRAQVVAGPYVAVDSAALVTAGLGTELAAQRQRGAQAVASVLGVDVDNSTVVADGEVAPGTLGPVERLVAPEKAFAPLDRPLTLANPFTVRTDDGRLVAAAAVDPGLSAHFATDDPVLGAHHLLADLAVLAYDSPGLARGVVVRPPPSWALSDQFLVPVFEAMGQGAVVRPVTLDQLFDEVPAATEGGTDLIRALRGEEPAAPDLPAAEVREVREGLASLASMTGAEEGGAASIERLLLVATAEGLSGEQRNSYLDGARRGFDERLARIDILSSGSFRLTSREATIPLTLVNDLDSAMRVWLLLESDKLDFVDSEPGTSGTASIPLVLQPGNTPVVVPVEARTSGDFPLLITLRSPDGRLEVAHARLTVRSTFLSGVGIALSAGAGMFLCVWWARHWRTARRARRLVTPQR